MEEAAFLVAMQRIIRGVEIQDDLLGRRLVRLEERVDEQSFDRRRVVADLVVTARLQGACSSRFKVLLSASGVQLPLGLEFPASVASTGSWRS